MTEKNWDGCEMDPATGKPLFSDHPHFSEARAAWLIGANGQWRVCVACAQHPALRRFKIRQAIEEMCCSYYPGCVCDEGKAGDRGDD